MRRKREEAPEWVFPWRRRRDAWLPRFAALALVSLVFAFVLTSLRIHVIPPTPWAARKATAIMTIDDASGRALTLRAKEGGPFPSRFVPAEWEGMATIERAAMAAARWQPPPYRPQLRGLPDETSAPPRLAAAGMPVWPASIAPPPAAPGPPVRTAPVLYPLSGISRQSMPPSLPDFAAEVTPEMLAEPWRFLLRLDAAGHVRDCVSLAGGDENGPGPLDGWLRRVRFPPEPGPDERWIVVGLGFANHPATPATDGTEPR